MRLHFLSYQPKQRWVAVCGDSTDNGLAVNKRIWGLLN